MCIPLQREKEYPVRKGYSERICLPEAHCVAIKVLPMAMFLLWRMKMTIVKSISGTPSKTFQNHKMVELNEHNCLKYHFSKSKTEYNSSLS